MTVVVEQSKLRCFLVPSVDLHTCRKSHRCIVGEFCVRFRLAIRDTSVLKLGLSFLQAQDTVLLLTLQAL